MAELNEEQLLLLNNLMYFNHTVNSSEYGSVYELAVAAEYYAANYPGNATFAGSFEDPENRMNMATIARAIKADPVLCELTIVDSFGTDGVHATCFKDSSGDVTVAIRGTGGTYEAWSDNVEGAFGTGTECQTSFGEFMERITDRYDNITITGHSKGGNLAQYATVMYGENIDRCVSFDGQGFNSEFCSTYSDEIAANRDKIKSISGKEDFVNTLLESIAGETVYLENGDNSHSSYTLWEANTTFEKGLPLYDNLSDGKFTDTVDQDPFVAALDKDLDKLVKDLTAFLPDEIEASLAEVLGSYLGMYFAKKTGQDTLIDYIEHIRKHFGLGADVIDYLLRTLEKKLEEWFGQKDSGMQTTNTAAGPCGFQVTFTGLCSLSTELESFSRIADQLAEEVESIHLPGCSFIGITASIRNAAKQIRKNSGDLLLLGRTAQDVSERYNSAEELVCRTYCGA